MQRHPRIIWFARFSILLVAYLICAGNITNSFLLKWGFRDNQDPDTYAQSYALVGMMNGDAPKPFVFRSVIPQLIKKGVEKIAPEVQAKLFKSITRYDSLRKSYFNGIPAEYWTPAVAIIYHAMYLLVYWVMFATLVFIHKICKLAGNDYAKSLGFVVAFSMFFQLIFQRGGYFYDFFEILGLIGSTYFFIKRKMLLSTLMIGIFAFNKETFFLFPAALYFLHGSDLKRSEKLAWLGIQLSLTIAARLIITNGYEGNAGGAVEVHFVENILFWINPMSYLTFYNSVGKGVFTSSIENPLISIPLLIYLKYSWDASESRLKRYFFASFLPVLLLYIFFGYEDEFRGFFLVFPSLLLIALNGVGKLEIIFPNESNMHNRKIE
jgi:hypothetical protein